MDYHVHTPLCNHARGSMEAFAARAASLGLSEICFLDHLTLHPGGSRLSMSPREVGLYIRACGRVREKFAGQLAIKIGLEVDYSPETFSRAREIVETFSLDVVAGSVHFLGSHNLVSHRERDNMPLSPAGRVERYLKLLFAMLDERFFDLACHLDVVKKFDKESPPGLAEAWDAVAARMAETGTVAEVNASGLSHPTGEAYPGPGLLSALARHGVPVTLGSDAHSPDEVGRHLPQVARELGRAGFSSLTTFCRRRPLAVALDPCLENDA
ncbi:MAG: histidinol-phosphatase [Proteobacteria bacterium]|nr:histidinol-phosphatase [Pseudomonadota bacterium]